ncbi:MAG TPA: metallophosphoesterase [Thermomicrobiales bacterium]|nr:metallophosphoesterase [Thermomicrobiales bacterium]
MAHDARRTMGTHGIRLWHQHTLSRTVALVALLMVLASPFLAGERLQVRAQTPSAEPAAVCAQTRTSYTVDVCLTAPDPSTPIRENPTISATVEISDPKITVKQVEFRLNDRRTLTDFDPPYTFELVATDFVDGSYTLTALASLSDGTDSKPASTKITLATGTEVVQPTTERFAVRTGRVPDPGTPFVMAVVGDGASGSPESEAVADLIGSWDPNLFLYLGDVYNSGTVTEFKNWYAPITSLGRFKSITNPTIGNHEYAGSDVPRGYLDYWGNPPHFYSVDTAGWHIVSLDSNTKFNELNPESQQMQWLVKDLESTTSACTLVMFHHPPFSVGPHGDTPEVQALWKLLVDHDVDLVMTGHDHLYQRWQAMDGSGKLDPTGTIPLVIGNGGQTRKSVAREDSRLAAPPVLTPGAMRMEMNPKGASMQFITTDGIVRDHTVVPCDVAAHDTTAPSAPGAPVATALPDGSVTLRWAPALDDTGIAAYDVYRDDTRIGSVPPGSAYIDQEAGASAHYRVVARDSAGNASPGSAATSVTDQHDPATLFADTFASGSLARWTKIDGLAMAPDSAEGATSGWMARARAGHDPAYARVTLPEDALTAPGDLDVSLRFCVVEQGQNPVVLLRLRSPDDQSLFGISLGAAQTLNLYNDVAKSGTDSSLAVEPRTWHTLRITTTGPPDNRHLTVRLDDAEVPELSGPIDLRSAGLAGIQLGDSAKGRVYDVQYRDVRIARTAPGAATPGDAGGATPASTPVSSTMGSLLAWIPAPGVRGAPRIHRARHTHWRKHAPRVPDHIRRSRRAQQPP